MAKYNWNHLDRQISGELHQDPDLTVADISKMLNIPYETLRVHMRDRGFHVKGVAWGGKQKLHIDGVEADEIDGELAQISIDEDGKIEANITGANVPKNPEQLAELAGIEDLSKYNIIKFRTFAREVYVKDVRKDLLFDEGKITGEIHDTGKMRKEVIWSCEAVFEPKVIKKTLDLQAIRVTVDADDVYKPRLAAQKYYKVLVVPDLHYGFQKIGGFLTTFHDEEAIDKLLSYVGFMATEYYDEVIVLGDIIDFPTISKFAPHPGTVGLLQDAIIEAGKFLAKLRHLTPKAKHILLEGNHDKRLMDYLLRQTGEVATVRAFDPKTLAPSEVELDLNYLLGLNEMGWKWFGNYPNNYYQSRNVRFEHGRYAISKFGGTVAKYLEEGFYNSSVVFGHIHRIEYASRSLDTLVGEKFAASIGTLCKIDGTVPGSKSFNNWQQGFAEVLVPTKEHHVPILKQKRFDEGGVV